MYGVSIEDAGDPVNVLRIRIQHIVVYLRDLTLSLAALSTLCFSGDWVLRVELNIFALTAVSLIRESYS